MNYYLARARAISVLGTLHYLPSLGDRPRAGVRSTFSCTLPYRCTIPSVSVSGIELTYMLCMTPYAFLFHFHIDLSPRSCRKQKILEGTAAQSVCKTAALKVGIFEDAIFTQSSARRV